MLFRSVPISAGHVFHQYTVRVLNGKRDLVQQYLTEAEIGTMVYYPVPQDRLPIYAGQYEPNPVSDRLAMEVLSLPIWPELGLNVIQAVVDVLNKETSSNHKN